MSDAMRALNEGLGGFDTVPGIEEPEPQGIEGQEPEGTEPIGGEPEPQTEPEPTQQEPEAAEPETRKPEGKKAKLKSSSRDWAEREKRRADKALQDLQAREAQLAQMQRQFAEQQKQVQALERQAKINANPTLRRAHELMQEGYKPENVEADANRLEAEGDKEGANIARQIAMHMRNLGNEEAQAQQAEQNASAETAWRQLPYGTEEFDNAVDQLKPGSPEFNNAWGFVEQNLIQQKNQSQDPWDQECARQFSDPKSEFGQRLSYFFHQTKFGKEVAKHAEGIILAFDICKMSMIIDHQALELQKLREENESYRGATSPSSGLPVNGNSYQPSLPNPHTDRNGFLNGFEKLGKEEMRRLLRSREVA